MEAKICPYCKEKIQEDAVKCKHCNSVIENPPLATGETLTACPFCKETIYLGATICKHCRSSIPGQPSEINEPVVLAANSASSDDPPKASAAAGLLMIAMAVYDVYQSISGLDVAKKIDSTNGLYVAAGGISSGWVYFGIGLAILYDVAIIYCAYEFLQGKKAAYKWSSNMNILNIILTVCSIYNGNKSEIILVMVYVAISVFLFKCKPLFEDSIPIKATS